MSGEQRTTWLTDPLWVGRLAFGACLLFAAGLSWFFHDRAWWAADDGGFGYVASRLLAGDILHKDIQDVHPGAIHFINALFLTVAGGDLVGLRYPLIFLTIAQTAIAFQLGRAHGTMIAIAAGVIVACFSFVQFINPTPNWYALTLAIFIGYFLQTWQVISWRRVFYLGALVGLVFQFRQLTACFLALPVVAVLLADESKELPFTRSDALAGKALLAFLAGAAFLYVVFSANVSGLILMGILPALALGLSATHARFTLVQVVQLIGVLCAGAIAVMVPIAIYHLAHGSLLFWLEDILVRPFALVSMPFFDSAHYYFLPVSSFISLLSGDLMAATGVIFWSALLILPAVLGAIAVTKSLRKKQSISSFTLTAIFYGLVSIHYEISIYLTYTSGIILLALLLELATARQAKLVAGGVIAFCLAAVFFNAGHTQNRSTVEIAKNYRGQFQTALVPGTSIQITKENSRSYATLIETINRCARLDEKIYAFPMQGHVYYLSKRQSPLPFFMSSLALRTDKEVDKALDLLTSVGGAALILHEEDNKYNTPRTLALLDKARQDYVELGLIDDWRIYQRKGHPLFASCQTAMAGGTS